MVRRPKKVFYMTVYLSVLGGLILKDEQRLAVEALRSGKVVSRYCRLASVNLSSTKASLSQRISLPSLLLFLFGVSSMINYSQMILA